MNMSVSTTALASHRAAHPNARGWRESSQELPNPWLHSAVEAAMAPMGAGQQPSPFCYRAGRSHPLCGYQTELCVLCIVMAAGYGYIK